MSDALEKHYDTPKNQYNASEKHCDAFENQYDVPEKHYDASEKRYNAIDNHNDALKKQYYAPGHGGDDLEDDTGEDEGDEGWQMEVVVMVAVDGELVNKLPKNTGYCLQMT